LRAGILVWTLMGAIATAATAEPAATPEPADKAARLISRFHMTRVPQEGVWFSVSYASDDTLAGDALPQRYEGHPHAAGSAILVVATTYDFSALHRLRTDEVWHFYGGSPLEIVLLYPDGQVRRVTLGNDVDAGQIPQFTVPHGVWQGAAPKDSSPEAYVFAGTQLSPGFDYADFEIGYRDELTRRYPSAAADIARLTRAEYAHRPPVAAKKP